MTVSERLEFDASAAESAVDALERALTSAVESFSQALTSALSPLDNIQATVDASEVTSGISDAVLAADSLVTPEAETDGMVQTIDSALEGIETTVPVDADTGPAQIALEEWGAEAESLAPDIPVTADTSAALDEIQGVADEAESIDVVVAVAADTAEATEQIAQLQETAGGADGAVGGLGESIGNTGGSAAASGAQIAGLATGMKVLGAGSQAAGGSVAGVGGLIGGINPVVGGAVAGVTALTAVLGGLFESGLKVTESKERFQDTFGALAAGVKDVNIGTLNGDLSDLALSLGTSTGKLRDAASSIGQLGDASGATAKQTATVAEQVNALALRSRALKPELGEAGDIANRLATALVRGGKFAAQFNIALTATEIKERALHDTGKATAGDLTQFEKLAAGAAIAAERYGNTLGQDVADGAEKAGIKVDKIKVQFARLKAELAEQTVPPILAFLEAAAPIGLALAQVFGALIQAILPIVSVFAEVASVLAPVVTMFAKGVSTVLSFLTPLIKVVAVVSAVTAAVSFLLSPLGLMVAAVAAVGVAVHLLEAPLGALGGLIKGAAGAVGGFVKSIPGVSGALHAIGTAGSFVGGAISSVGNALGFGGKKHDDFKKKVEEATKALTDENGELDLSTEKIGEFAKSGSAFKDNAKDLESIGLDFEKVATLATQGADGATTFANALASMDDEGKAKELAGDFEELQKQLQGAAQAQLDMNIAAGDSAKKQLESGEEIDAATRVTLEQAVALGETSRAAEEAAESNGDYVTATKDVAESTQAAAAAQLDAMVAAGQLSKAQRDGALAAATGADGQADYVAALTQVQTRQAEAAEATKNFGAVFTQIQSTLPAVAGAYDQLSIASQTLDNAQTKGNETQTAVNTGLVGLALALNDASVPTEQFATIAAGLGISVEELGGFIAATVTEISDFAAEAAGKLPTVGAAFEAAAGKAKEAGHDLSAVDIKKAMEEQLQAIQGFNANLQTLVGAGFGDLAGLAAQQGPEFVKAFADAVKGGKTDVLNSIRDTLVPGITDATAQAQNVLSTQVGPAFVAKFGSVGTQAGALFGTNIGSTVNATTGALTGMQLAVTTAGPPVVAGFGALGTGATTAYGQGVAPLPGQTTQAISGALGAIVAGQAPIQQAAAAAGSGATTNFDAQFAQIAAQTGLTVQEVIRQISLGQDPIATSSAAVAHAGLTGFEDTWSGLPSTVNTTISGALGQITAAAPTMGTNAEALGTAGSTRFQSGFHGILQHVNTTTAAAKTAVDSAAAPISSASKKVGDQSGESFGKAFATGTKKGAEDAKKAAQAVIDKVDDVAGSAKRAGTGVGESFGQGIVSGINNYVDDIRRAAARSVREAESAARAEAHSKSPSKLFAALGKDLSLGTALGIGDGEAAVVREAENIIRAAAAAMESIASRVSASVTSDAVQTVQYGSISDDAWQKLRDMGYKGIAGDNMEALYIPQSVLNSVTGAGGQGGGTPFDVSSLLSQLNTQVMNTGGQINVGGVSVDLSGTNLTAANARAVGLDLGQGIADAIAQRQAAIDARTVRSR